WAYVPGRRASAQKARSPSPKAMGKRRRADEPFGSGLSVSPDRDTEPDDWAGWCGWLTKRLLAEVWTAAGRTPGTSTPRVRPLPQRARWRRTAGATSRASRRLPLALQVGLVEHGPDEVRGAADDVQEQARRRGVAQRDRGGQGAERLDGRLAEVAARGTAGGTDQAAAHDRGVGGQAGAGQVANAKEAQEVQHDGPS